MAQSPELAIRGSDGVTLVKNATSADNRTGVCIDKNTCKNFQFSKDGDLFAWTNGEIVSIRSTESGSVMNAIDKPKTQQLHFSPKGTVLATWESYAVTKDNPNGSPNLNLWDCKTGGLLRGLVQKKPMNWHPQWSLDEGIAARNVNNEIHFFEGNNFETIADKLRLQKVSEFGLSPILNHVAAYVPGIKGAPSFVRVFKYPNFEGQHAALANKSFFKAERIHMYWNPKGTALLVLTSTESSGSSYYGEQGLHFLAVNGESCLVPLAKKGPIYSIEWNPSSQINEFCVVYGYMPAKATIFNVKMESVFDFGTGSRNAVYFNRFGNLLCLAGFGNLRGNLEFWDVKGKKIVSNPTADDSTFFQWCPDGEYVVTATNSPRLRVANGFKIWHYSGVTVHKQMSNGEQWEVVWKPVKEGVYSEKPISHKPVHVPEHLKQDQPLNKPAVYRPPGAQGRPSNFKVHEENEKPQGGKVTADNSSESMSKNALKNKKKRDAKARAKQDENDVQTLATTGGQSMAESTGPSTGDPEIDKKIRNLRKKIQQVEKLKELKEAGKQLEKNQLDKLKTESVLLQELEHLEV